MTELAIASPAPPASPQASRFDNQPTPGVRALYSAVIIAGVLFAGWSVFGDITRSGEFIAIGTLVFLGVALLIALGFEFVNGFHDTANAVATVIYTNAMPAPVAVVWSGVFNFLGVMLSSGAVAYAIIALLPVELILNVGSGTGYAMILALLLGAVLWNLATWYVGLPNSSSHTLIGSILGVGLANQLIAAGSKGGTAGVDWAQVQKVLTALLVSPLIGFFAAMTLVLIMRAALRNPKLFTAPDGHTPPPAGIRALLIATCTAVSFTHGSNDGQKGMGLIMLILIGCAPTAYALNRNISPADTPAFVASANAAATAFTGRAELTIPMQSDRDTLRQALQARKAGGPQVETALAALSRDFAAGIDSLGSLAAVPAAGTSQVRSDMYLVLETSKLLLKNKDAEQKYGASGIKAIKDFDAKLETATRFIPLWVKIAVAIALGLGTMIGWKRIVITVGEKIGKSEFTYAMGASAELMTATTIYAADAFGMPVSTTHILTSGVAGAAVGQGQGLNLRTIRNMATAWIITLPVTMALSGGLYWLFLTLFVGR
jgi:inorganic phosphate transporter, PiT family